MARNTSKNKKTRAEELQIKRKAEKKRYEKIKNDPLKWQEQKEKERLKYIKKKENKTVKLISEKTSREKRICRKNWRKNTNTYRKNIKTQKEAEQFLRNNSPPSSADEDEIFEEQIQVAAEFPASPIITTPQHKAGQKIATRNRKI